MQLVKQNNKQKRIQTVTAWLNIERENFDNPSLNVGDVVEVNGKRYVILHIIASYMSYSSNITYSVVAQDLSVNVNLFDDMDLYPTVEGTDKIKAGEFYKTKQCFRFGITDSPEGDFIFTYVLDGVKSTVANQDENSITITTTYRYVPILKQSEVNRVIYKEKIKKFKLVKSK
ncbi:hypothetical protein [Ligilactobacillus salivarius]|uniref:hypothetical protein n=1 Tax=Ligilactobacillus salivarius TaxID=1624 RepID=UPI0009DABB1B|nr:hypothetical protein [Ligilactobacillus salivarius]OQR18791.1 hypothetical protein B6U39_09290 [Ligilactobacillus salivarius]